MTAQDNNHSTERPNTSAPLRITRRQLGVASGLAVLGGLVGTTAPTAWAAPSPTLGTPRDLPLFSGGFPRSFFFRSSEVLIGGRGLEYDEWEETFLPLNGIQGKVLQETRSDWVSPDNVVYFNRFKERHPEKAVMLHYNGSGRDPLYGTEGFFAGHWLYRAGTQSTESVGADATVIKVGDTAMFTMRAGRRGDRGDDICITAVGEDGRPDWSVAEQVQLVGIDAAASTITVRRGLFGTSAVTWPAGAYLAPHVVTGPWGPPHLSNLLWSYNFSTRCPTDAAGRNCGDALAEDLAGLFNPGGLLESFDGMEFDVFNFRAIEHTDGGGQPAEDADANGDGQPGGMYVDGVNTYGIGSLEFSQKLRALLPNKVIMGDGQNELNNQRGFGVLGMEAEGFPSLVDREYVDWSSALNRIGFWVTRSDDTAFNYINYKYRGERSADIDYRDLRLNLAASLVLGAGFTFTKRPPRPGHILGPFDELVKGNLNELNWLGAPLADPVHLAERQPDLLTGAGVSWRESMVSKFTGTNMTFTRDLGSGDSPRLVATYHGAAPEPSPEPHFQQFEWGSIDHPGGDLLLVMSATGTPLADYPSTIGRRLYLSAIDAEGNGEQLFTWIDPDAFMARFYFRDLAAGPVHLHFEVEGTEEIVIERLTAHNSADTVYRAFEGGVTFANPSNHDQTFDLASEFPDQGLTRLQGTPDQDPVVNNGQPLGTSLTLPAKDGLIVRRA
ncbi:hypothetical protein [Ruania alba]|uniref:Uncharacterized protein n=1 Tax=Ruania alba TaxID=648782 RepID=A0A1H5MHN6_9MICO|nr:hypothetical protein [Ruania alba]SEE88181.1 hypothetical protein SAMN04488554_3361 [Ruania alba]